MQGRALTEEERHQTRAHLIDIAVSLLARHGRPSVSLRRVASEAGMSRSTPYIYFADKAALLDAVRTEGIHRLRAGCELAQREHVEIAARLAATGKAYIRFALTHPNLYDLLFEPVDSSPEHDEAIARYRGIAEAPLQEAWSQGLTTLPPARLAHVLWSATHGILSLARAGKLRHGVNLEDALDDLRLVLAFGFTPRSTP